MNTLYYGENLNILRRYIKDESVDLVYLDPPFNEIPVTIRSAVPVLDTVTFCEALVVACHRSPQ